VLAAATRFSGSVATVTEGSTTAATSVGRKHADNNIAWPTHRSLAVTAMAAVLGKTANKALINFRALIGKCLNTLTTEDSNPDWDRRTFKRIVMLLTEYSELTIMCR
jgi:hypothetical protein